MTRVEKEIKMCKSCRFWNDEGSRCWNFNLSAKELKYGKQLILRRGTAFDFGTTSCPVFEDRRPQNRYGKVYVSGIEGSSRIRLELIKLLAIKSQACGEIFLWKDNFRGIEISQKMARQEKLNFESLELEAEEKEIQGD